MMGIPGIWWVDLQIDGVKRGHLAQQPDTRVPHAGTIIAANFTSPIDAVYLAAIFDPVFTLSYPGSRKVRRVSLIRAVLQALLPPGRPFSAAAPPPTGLTDLRALLRRYPDRAIVVFPECATTNGKGVLPFSPSLLAAPPDVAIFPVSLRYTPHPPRRHHPRPRRLASLLVETSQPPHALHQGSASPKPSFNTSLAVNGVAADHAVSEGAREGSDVTPEEQLVLDRIADALARLGRNRGWA